MATNSNSGANTNTNTNSAAAQQQALQTALANVATALAAVVTAGNASGLKNSAKFANKLIARVNKHNATVPARIVKRQQQNARKAKRIAALQQALQKAQQA